jgi:molybdopterin-guanine dinucleotide biosynthesis protein A
MVRFTRAIIAGGKSERMGQDKAFLDVGGVPIVERILQQTEACQAEATHIVTNTPSAYEHLGLPMYADVLVDCGSLGGIYSALVHSDTPYTLVTAVDMPFVSGDLWRFMLGFVADGAYDVVVPRVESYPQGLHALYSQACLAPIKRRLDAHRLKVIGFYEDVRVKYLDEADYVPYADAERALMNVNTPDDLARARAMATA